MTTSIKLPFRREYLDEVLGEVFVISATVVSENHLTIEKRNSQAQHEPDGINKATCTGNTTDWWMNITEASIGNAGNDGSDNLESLNAP